ncbi:MAG: tetratricopeptide repeat protein [Terriglobia bacterium]
MYIFRAVKAEITGRSYQWTGVPKPLDGADPADIDSCREAVRTLKKAVDRGQQAGRHRRNCKFLNGVVVLSLLLSAVLSLAVYSLAQAQGAMQAQRFAERALEFARSGNFSQAEAELRRAIVLAPDDARFLGDLGAILGTEGKLRDAAPYLEKALKIDPGNLSLRRDVAATELNLGEERRAERNLEYILRRRQDDRQATLLLGMVAANMKEYRQAVTLFEAIPRLVQQRPQAVAALARCYYHTGQIAKARQLLLAMLKTPADAQGIFLGAQMAEVARDGPTAERLFDSIRSTYPDFPRLEYHLADAEYESGGYAESQSLLEQLI